MSLRTGAISENGGESQILHRTWKFDIPCSSFDILFFPSNMNASCRPPELCRSLRSRVGESELSHSSACSPKRLAYPRHSGEHPKHEVLQGAAPCHTVPGVHTPGFIMSLLRGFYRTVNFEFCTGLGNSTFLVRHSTFFFSNRI